MAFSRSRRAHARGDLGIDGVHIQADVDEPGAGDVLERLPDGPLDADPVDVAHRVHPRAELAKQVALGLVE